MKKLITLLVIAFTLTLFVSGARNYNDSINVAGISGTDTVIVISKNYVVFGRPWSCEIEYTDLDADDATFDIGTRLEISGGATGEIADSTFNSFGSLLGSALPKTLNATSNADSYYGKASEMWVHPDRFQGTELLLKVNPGSVTSGYIRYKIIW